MAWSGADLVPVTEPAGALLQELGLEAYLFVTEGVTDAGKGGSDQKDRSARVERLFSGAHPGCCGCRP